MPSRNSYDSRPGRTTPCGLPPPRFSRSLLSGRKLGAVGSPATKSFAPVPPASASRLSNSPPARRSATSIHPMHCQVVADSALRRGSWRSAHFPLLARPFGTKLTRAPCGAQRDAIRKCCVRARACHPGIPIRRTLLTQPREFNYPEVGTGPNGPRCRPKSPVSPPGSRRPPTTANQQTAKAEQNQRGWLGNHLPHHAAAPKLGP